MIYLQLFLSFLQIGALSFGGGYAAMPLIQEQVVTLHGWLSMEAFTDLVTIAEMTPGPIAVNSATFVGTQIAGRRCGCGDPWLHLAFLHNRNFIGIYLHEIPEYVSPAGNTGIPSPGGCGNDRQGRSDHFGFCLFYQRNHRPCPGKCLHPNGCVFRGSPGAPSEI